MGDLNDFQRFSATLRNELEALEADHEAGLITTPDYERIDRFVKDRDDIKVSTLAEYLKRTRLTARRADIALTEMDHADLQDVFFAFEHGDHPDIKDDGLKPNTMRNYRKALRIFFAYLDRDWWDEITVGAPVKTRISEDDVLNPEEIEALRQASTRPRETALVEFLADTGARLSMVGSLRIADVHLEGDRAYYTPNPNASGLKGAPQQPYPIIDSKAALRTYIRHSHPQPDNPEAAVFHKVQGYTEGESGAITPQHLSRLLKELAEEADIDKPVNPHSFRHAAISRMYREGYEKQEIQHRVAWNLDTDMWERYVHLTAEDMNEQIYAAAGVIEESEAAERRRERCGNCREVVPQYASYCPTCGEPATAETRELTTEAESAVVEDLAGAEDALNRQVLKKVHDLIKANPQVLDVDGD
ncbi:MAG: tyrosine-type recombinase/integrase [Halobacteriales archaeon]